MYVRYIRRTYYKYRYIRCKLQYILTLVSGAARPEGSASPSTKACTVNNKYLLNNKLKLFGEGNLDIRINWTILSIDARTKI